ncbi:hypothetical protein AABB24_037361 [Solanum stoloniferum]|uniref:Uncharacterized protein n=1 Tax=Solanum stoloniferum TaxID=62892 RepID=A0ABD2R4G8_9SOLN
MNLASIIHNNSTQLPPKFISTSHKISPISSPSTSPKSVHFQLAHLRSCVNLCRLDNLNLRYRGSRPTSLSCMFGASIFGCNCRGRRYSAVVSCLRKSEQGEELSNAEERTQGSGTYVSSVRTVALCQWHLVLAWGSRMELASHLNFLLGICWSRVCQWIIYLYSF